MNFFGFNIYSLKDTKYKPKPLIYQLIKKDEKMMDQNFQKILGQDELIPEKPFTHTDYIHKDQEILVHMGKRICEIMETYREELQKGLRLDIEEPDGRSHRFLVPNPTKLLDTSNIYFVGFFGQKRAGKDSAYFGGVDDRLVGQIPKYPEILSYSTMAMENGDFSNLVLVSDEEIKLKWMDGEIHKRAVSRSPGYYRSIRINNGVLPDGIIQYETLQINKVKYYDYNEEPPWKALRRLTGYLS